MINYEWKIDEVASVDGKLKHVKYKVTAIDGDNKVETEGYAYFDLPDEVVFSNLMEAELLEYTKRFYTQNNINSIEYRLAEQMVEVKKSVSTEPPWHVPTFKVGI